MTPNIFGTRFVGARTAAWHVLGTVIPAGQIITVEEALRIGRIDFDYVKVPVGFTDPFGYFHHSGDRSVILRSPTHGDDAWTEMGVVSNGYEFLQNSELARGLDAIAKETGWSFETVGALGRGETVFMTLRTGKRSVFGDDYDTYIMASDGKASQRALQISTSRVRTVCENTLIAADNAATVKITIAHDAHVRNEWGFWLDLIGQLQTEQDTAFAQMEQMASVKIHDDQARQIINAAFRLPSKSAKVKQGEALLALPTLAEAQRRMVVERTQQSEDRAESEREQVVNRRMAAFSLYERFNAGREHGARRFGRDMIDPDTLYHTAGTPYAALQAVTELVDWGGTASREVAARSALFGEGAEVKSRAWKEALVVARR